MKRIPFAGFVLLLGVSTTAGAQLEMRPLPDSRTTAAPSAMVDMPEGLIKLDVLVHDAGGNPISGLSAADLGLLENARPQSILSFQAFDGRGDSTEPQVKVIVLIDTTALPESLATPGALRSHDLSASEWGTAGTSYLSLLAG